MSEPLTRAELLGFTAEIVAAQLANNNMNIAEIPGFIQQVFQTLTTLDAEHHNATSRPKPFVPINKSITDEYIICLEDGKKLQMLKRYLKTTYNMSVEQYKERWGLGPDYPVVAPSYAKRRSAIAKSTGLGTKGRRRKLTVVDNKTAVNL